MSTRLSRKPTTFQDLFDFYYEEVKMLYGYASSQNQLAVEVLFEIHAAFDHVSRRWRYHETEETAVDRAHGHLKRSCLDIYKMVTREAARQYTELLNIELSEIDNGVFDHQLRVLFAKIRAGATEARLLEGSTDHDDTDVPSFALWKAVMVDCLALQSEFHLSPKVTWAKKKTKLRRLNERVGEVCTGFAIAAAFYLLTSPPDTFRHIALCVLIAALLLRIGFSIYSDQKIPHMFPMVADIDKARGS